MTLTDLQPFTAALKSHQGKTVLPTLLDSAEIRQQLDAATRRQSFFSAETMFGDYLDQLKGDVESLINPVTTQRADRVTAENPQGNVTTGLDPATARLRAKELLQRIGYAPAVGEQGTLKDLSSDARINLVLKTNTELSQGAGALLQGSDPAVLEAFPCWELYRLQNPKTKGRDWPSRWRIAASISGDVDAARVLDETGRMVARKDSPIWDEIGNSNNFDDGLDNNFPPFAFNSGMWTKNVAYDDAEALGLVNLETKVASPLPDDLAQLFGVAA